MLKKALLVGIGLSWLAVAFPAAQERATFVLTNGERHDGAIVYGRGDNNIVDGNFHLSTGGADLSFPMNNVAVIDFAGGDPSGDAQKLPADNSGLIVMRNGAAERGRLHNIIGGDQVQWVNEAGQRRNIPIRDVSRIYMNPQNARSTFLAKSGESQAAQPPGGVTIRVPANQQWTDTGITVRRGDQVLFYATGDIGTGNGLSAGVAGSPVMDKSRMPLPSAAGGSLIGRVGNSAPFYVGWNPNPIAMPAAGRLYLGINDDNVNDNEGAFTVVVSSPQRTSLFQRR
jgi:hypothetical protein